MNADKRGFGLLTTGSVGGWHRRGAWCGRNGEKIEIPDVVDVPREKSRCWREVFGEVFKRDVNRGDRWWWAFATVVPGNRANAQDIEEECCSEGQEVQRPT